MKSRHKKVLRRNIKLIMFSLIGTIILVYILGFFILKNYEHQVKSIADQTIQFYGQDMDKDMENINRQLVNTLLNNELINKLSELNKLERQGDPAVRSIALQNELVAYFNSLNLNYGRDYHFWFFHKGQDIFVTSGEGDYTDKELYKKEIRKLSQEDAIPVMQKGKWFLMEINHKLFLTTIYELKDQYVGCWILPESLYSSLGNFEDNSGTIPSTIVFRAAGTDKESIDGYKDSYVCKYTFHYANVDMEMTVYQSLQRKASYFQLAMIVAAVTIVALCIGTLSYSRYAISAPLKRFSENLKNYTETGEFEQQVDYEEFEGVGDVLSNLEQEIKQLKINVYEENLEKQKAQIEYMQLQIRPHFYINCLNSIFSMSQLGHYEEIQELVRYVSSYMRSVFRKGMNSIALEAELYNVENYIRIHKILYRYSCTFQLEVNQDILSASIPPLLVMIFVENSIKYTSGMKKDVVIRIKAEFENEDRKRFFVEIADTGPGFSEEILKEIHSEDLGKGDDRFQIGIRNARNRLQMLYGSDAELIIGNGEMGGAKVRLIIPFQRVKESP